MSYSDGFVITSLRAQRLFEFFPIGELLTKPSANVLLPNFVLRLANRRRLREVAVRLGIPVRDGPWGEWP